MSAPKTQHLPSAMIVALFLMIIGGFSMAQAQTYTLLYQFKAGNDGTQPYAGLTIDTKRDALYGTTYADGSFASGTVFKLASSGESVLHSFTGTGGDGEYPFNGGNLALDVAGNLYGSTTDGGSYASGCGSLGCGMVFKIDQTGHETVLYQFGNYPDGATPYGSLVADESNNLYGTTATGGTSGAGTVFEVDQSGNETILYNFGSGADDGFEPFAGLVRDKEGNLYGTTLEGGPGGGGTVFKVNASGEETVLYGFGSASGDGILPWAGLTLDSKGNLYGTTDAGGANGRGTVFKISPKGTETVIYSFGPAPDGNSPNEGDGVILDPAGNLYGTTSSGGSFGLGTAFKIDTNGKETILHSFSGKDGKVPAGGLSRDPKGNLYGAASGGGAYGGGVIFRITP